MLVPELHHVLPAPLKGPFPDGLEQINGQRAYTLARNGCLDIDLRPCDITIHEIELLDYTYPRIEIQVTCSKGTFIRTLAMDIGVKLTGGAHVEILRRTRVGDYEL
mgnify:CR=1 FL=1